MTALDLLLRDCRLADGRAIDIGCRDGVIAELGALTERATHRLVECAGRAVTPGLVDAHIHLDKALLSERAPGVLGTLDEAIRVTGLAKRRFTVEDIRARARAVLDMAVSHGTTAMRSHVEGDPIVESRPRGARALREEYRRDRAAALRPSPGGHLEDARHGSLLARALREGADLVGGCRT